MLFRSRVLFRSGMTRWRHRKKTREEISELPSWMRAHSCSSSCLPVERFEELPRQHVEQKERAQREQDEVNRAQGVHDDFVTLAITHSRSSRVLTAPRWSTRAVVWRFISTLLATYVITTTCSSSRLSLADCDVYVRNLLHSDQ